MIGRSLSERYAARRPVARVTCAACGASTWVAPHPGHVVHTEIAHEDGCPFFAAIEGGKGPGWVAEHGYPITFDRVPTKGAA